MYHLVPENFTQGKSMLEEAVRVYNNERIHMNIDLMVPSKARELHNRPPNAGATTTPMPTRSRSNTNLSPKPGLA